MEGLPYPLALGCRSLFAVWGRDVQPPFGHRSLLVRCGRGVQPTVKVFRVKLDNAIDPMAIAALLPWMGVHVGPGLKEHAVSEMRVAPHECRYRHTKVLLL